MTFFWTGGGGSGNPRMLLLRRGKINNSLRLPALKVWVVAGVTRDANGTPLGNCVVHLFTTVDDVRVASTVSDAGGNYSFAVNTAANYYCVAYLAGSPDVAGTTVNTLTGA